MRIRALVASFVLLLPAGAGAQRIPLITRRSPTRPAELPPQPAPIANELAYKRSHLTVETYPLVSSFASPGFTNYGQVNGWTSLGAGTRADYRFSRFVSGTMDVTSTVLGGPAQTETVELGTRLHRERTDSRAYPFLDLRLGYIAAYRRGDFGTIFDDGFGGSPVTPTTRYSTGYGAVAGVGMEYALARSWSLTTAFSVMPTRMSTKGIQNFQTAERAYGMTAFRYTLGISYNPVRVIRAAGSTDMR